MKNPLTLSQCMIVKNEEKNIEKALSWGRGIAYEQIVVDTGSTDRTVGIAESMGAKVLHFEWVDDFSAAKNYAIEQATGDWIAFLDADEYFTGEDAEKLIHFLEAIWSDEAKREKYLVAICPWVHLRDDGSVILADTQMRIFRNIPQIRYIGRVHEWLSVEEACAAKTEDFVIMHTGYSDSAYKLTGKAVKYIKLLRLEVEDKPHDMNIKAYLADSLLADAIYGTGGEPARAEAERLYKEVAMSDAFVLPLLKRKAYERVLKAYIYSSDADAECERISEKAISQFPDDCMLMCHYAGVLNKKGDFRAAYGILKKCESKLCDSTGAMSELTRATVELLTAQMVLAAQGLGDLGTVIEYATVQLMQDKEKMELLRPFIATLVRHCKSVKDITDTLAQVYDMKSMRDLLLIARAAKDCGAIDLARAAIDMAGQ